MYIRNLSKHVITLNTLGMPKLRLYPGYNQVKKEELNEYKKNRVVQAHFSESLAVVDSIGISTDDKSIAAEYKKKNEQLNKAQPIILAKDKK